VNSKNLQVVGKGQGGGVRHPLRILIGDDDRDTVTMLKAILRDEGHEVQTVLRGDEALEVARLMRPDVVILDVNMPGLSGYAVARELRNRSGIAAPVLIAISGVWKEPSDSLLGKSVGFDHYLVKPCDPADLIRLLEPLRRGGRDAAAG
jgi:DNA-binding response OmpR family regulator